MKLVLGTVQFGCQYGINSEGKPTSCDVEKILKEAERQGICLLDTSAAYGNAEEVLGEVMGKMKHSFKIISKYPRCGVSVEDSLETSLEHLKVSSLYGYLLHHFDLYKENPAIWNDFRRLKSLGKMEKIGFSIYSPDELELLLKNGIEFDLIQFPYNIFDRQFEPFMKILKDREIEIHVRSTFLQGLFFKDREYLPEKLQPFKKYLLELDDFARQKKLNVGEVALNFNLQHPCIDGVLIGVDNIEQLEMNLNSIKKILISLSLNIKEKELLNPVNWK